ncbi:hypothetical protein QJS10_CPA05g02341 [Acorus calamus]|uniref:Syntaxin 6/10/61 N-terminal domain-containing protein n=1 Tax=Acorus calamus TaxID=4465 RepID=A0AAV9ET28_ACOCL|nr:hypothetical protein QJS10_CPA05g02341 [Acorus calamus]
MAMAAVANSFDQWQKDSFFSAAEEVQESADLMESVYRMWLRGHSDGFDSDHMDELLKELQTALGTAKWQLEEFDRAISLSCRNVMEDNAIARRRQFVAVIENQVSHIEKVIQDSLIEDGKQPLRWVQLDDEESSELEAFLSGTSQPSSSTKDSYVSSVSSKRSGSSQESSRLDSVKCLKETPRNGDDDAEFPFKSLAKEVLQVKDTSNGRGVQLNGQKRTWSSPDMGAWRIAIPDEDVGKKALEASTETSAYVSRHLGFLRSVELAMKTKWLRNSFPKEKVGGDPSHHGSRGPSRFTQGMNERSGSCLGNYKEDLIPRQLLGRVGGYQRQLQGSIYTQYSRSLRITFLLVLTIFLVVPFVIYSS